MATVEALPQYYRENFFSGDTLFYTEQAAGHFGVTGVPVPYTIRDDTLVTVLLLFCFVAFVISMAHTRDFVGRQLKRIFRTSLPGDDDFKETSGELRFQLFLILMSCLLMAVTAYYYTSYYLSDTLVVDSELLMLGIFFCVFVGYQLLRWSSYALVNPVFFPPRQNSLWGKTLLFLDAGMGVLIFPVVMLVVYFNLSFQKAVYYFLFVFIFTKSIAFYKCWSIFFRQNGIYLQTFLYFCALEIVPLLCLVAGLPILTEHLKLNF